MKKLYTLAMLMCVIAISTILLTLTGCSTAVVTPTPFKTGAEIPLNIIQGCSDLHKSVDEHNRQHPESRMEADC